MERKMSDKTEETEKLDAYWVISCKELKRLMAESKQAWRESTGKTRIPDRHCLVLRFEDAYAGKERPEEQDDSQTQLRLVRRY